MVFLEALDFPGLPGSYFAALLSPLFSMGRVGATEVPSSLRRVSVVHLFVSRLRFPPSAENEVKVG